MVKTSFNFEYVLLKTKDKAYRRHIGSMLTVTDKDWPEKDISEWCEKELKPVTSAIMGAVGFYLNKGELPKTEEILERMKNGEM